MNHYIRDNTRFMNSIYLFIPMLFIPIGLLGFQNSFAEFLPTCVLENNSGNATCTVQITSHETESGYIGISGPSCSAGPMDSFTEGERLFIGPRLYDLSISQAGCYRTWIIWYISEVPYDATIVDAVLKFKKLPPSHSLHTGNVHALIYSLENDPRISDPSTINEDIRNGALYVDGDSSFAYDGSHITDLGSQADVDMMNKLKTGKNWFGVGLSATNESTSDWNMAEINKKAVLSITYQTSSDNLGNDVKHATQRVLFDDSFDADLNGWKYRSYPNSYVEPLDNYTSSIAKDELNHDSSVLISGDGFAVTGGIEKKITVPSDMVNGLLVLSFDAKADADGFSYNYPNIWTEIRDESGKTLYGEYILFGGTSSNSEWKSYQIDVTKYITNQNQMTIFLGLADSWEADLQQKVWFDNIKLTVMKSKADMQKLEQECIGGPNMCPEQRKLIEEKQNQQNLILVLAIGIPPLAVAVGFVVWNKKKHGEI